MIFMYFTCLEIISHLMHPVVCDWKASLHYRTQSRARRVWWHVRQLHATVGCSLQGFALRQCAGLFWLLIHSSCSYAPACPHKTYAKSSPVLEQVQLVAGLLLKKLEKIFFFLEAENNWIKYISVLLLLFHHQFVTHSTLITLHVDW